MDLTNPIRSVIPSAHGAVLAVLARTEEPLSGRGVAQLTRPPVSQRRVSEVLGELTRAGIVLREQRPPAHLYLLNHDHVSAAAIEALAQLWATLLNRIRAELQSWRVAPDAAWLFGSAARGEATSGSDIDILLVRPKRVSASADARAEWEVQTDTLAEHVQVWSGNRCELLEMDAYELQSAVKRNDRLVRDLREHAVPLAGSGHRALLRDGRPT